MEGTTSVPTDTSVEAMRFALCWFHEQRQDLDYFASEMKLPDDVERYEEDTADMDIFHKGMGHCDRSFYYRGCPKCEYDRYLGDKYSKEPAIIRMLLKKGALGAYYMALGLPAGLLEVEGQKKEEEGHSNGTSTVVFSHK